MDLGAMFFLNSALFGVGLAMDAFSVSIANSLNEPQMKKRRMYLIAGVFGAFQALMPMLGWVCVSVAAHLLEGFVKWTPWIALLLLLYIGGKMLLEGIRGGEEARPAVSFRALIVQGVATSIDALSVGFTIAELNWAQALIESAIIAVVTFVICMLGLFIGKKAGGKVGGKASVLGGVILILIGIEIFVTGVIL